MRVVLDTNVLISALIKKGNPKIFLDQVAGGKIKLVLSAPILEEFIRVMRRKKLKAYLGEREVADFVMLLDGLANSFRSNLKLTSQGTRATTQS